jgi:hypothetical protein
MLAGAGTRVWRSDLHGDVVVSRTTDGLRVSTRGTP